MLLGELSQGEATAGTVAGGHSQSAAATAGHTGEALAPREVEDSDAIKGYVGWVLPGSPLQDGQGWKARGRASVPWGTRGHSITSQMMLNCFFTPHPVPFPPGSHGSYLGVGLAGIGAGRTEYHPMSVWAYCYLPVQMRAFCKIKYLSHFILAIYGSLVQFSSFYLFLEALYIRY